MELRAVRVQVQSGGVKSIDGKVGYQPPKHAIGKFHCWEQYKDDDICCIHGIVEMEDGSVERFEVNEIKFIA